MTIAFILGAHKCATSSFAGMLNCHPQILSLYEVALHQAIPSKYGKQLLRTFPTWRKYFGEKGSLRENYDELADELVASGYPYRVLVDKLPGISVQEMRNMRDAKVIYMVRDVRTWIAKVSAKDHYCCKDNLVPAVIDYTLCFLHSFFRLPDNTVLHVDFNDFLSQDSQVPQRTCEFLGVPYLPVMAQWWNQVDTAHQQDCVKSAVDWLSGHGSAMISPETQDTSVELTEQPFWKAFLPIFDFYYQRLNTEIDHAQITTDISTLKEMRTAYSVPLNEAFIRMETETFKVQAQAPSVRVPLLKRILQGGANYLIKLSERF